MESMKKKHFFLLLWASFCSVVYSCIVFLSGRGAAAFAILPRHLLIHTHVFRRPFIFSTHPSATQPPFSCCRAHSYFHPSFVVQGRRWGWSVDFWWG